MGYGRRFALGTLVVALLAAGVDAQNGRARRVETKPAVATGRAPEAAANVPVAPAAFKALPFTAGETLSYNVDWNNYVAAARMEITVAAQGKFFGKEAIHLTASVRTVGIVRALLAAVDSQSESYVDPKTVLPFRAERNNDVNGKTTKQLVTFDRAKKTATAGERSIPIGLETGDALALLYRLRAMRLEDGATFTLDGFEGEKRIEVQASVEGRESVTTPAGSFETLRVACVPVENGQPNEASRFDMWFSDDTARVPVQISARSKYGTVRIALTKSVSGGR
jgi:hypothetical protein